jgi:hypothetical protein
MVEKFYPFLKNICELKKRIVVVAAGTHLDHNCFKRNWMQDITPESLKWLKYLDEHSLWFTTRGLLTQRFCEHHGLKNAIFAGDIAYFDERFINRKFSKIQNVKKIAISDPHYPNQFMDSFNYLIESLFKLFPNVQIDVLLHGKNKQIEDVMMGSKCNVIKVYDRMNGLDQYDQYDLHIGYRIHGCISMLKRRKVSYLLEQDGRGLDYGITFPINISVRSTIEYRSDNIAKGIIKYLYGKEQLGKPIVDKKPVDMLLAIISNDLKNNFSRFKYFDFHIDEINEKYTKLFSLIFKGQ